MMENDGWDLFLSMAILHIGERDSSHVEFICKSDENFIAIETYVDIHIVHMYECIANVSPVREVAYISIFLHDKKIYI